MWEKAGYVTFRLCRKGDRRISKQGKALFLSFLKSKKSKRLQINTISALRHVTLVDEIERDYGHGLTNKILFYFTT